MSNSFLRYLVGNMNCTLNCLPVIGSASGSGILVGKDNDMYDIHSLDIISLFISCFLNYETKNIVFRVISVYGSPYVEGK
jgi:hypothetical protein